jgi:hypothetical protein
MSNFKSAAKRKREQAKLDKRQAKDQKRALRRAERSGSDVGTPTATTVAVAPPPPNGPRPVPGAATSRKPRTLSEAVDLWRKTKVVPQKSR